MNNQDLEPIKKRMSAILDKSVIEREISFAMQAINSSNGLQQCSKESLQKAVYNIALTGLSLNPVLKYAYLIPRWSRDGNQAVLEPSYQGLIKLLTDTGSIVAIYAHLVHEGDDFEVVYGTSVEINHKPKFASKNVTHVYAVAILQDSNFKQIEVMTIAPLGASFGTCSHTKPLFPNWSGVSFRNITMLYPFPSVPSLRVKGLIFDLSILFTSMFTEIVIVFWV